MLRYKIILIRAAIKLISILLGISVPSIREYSKAVKTNDRKYLKKVLLKSSKITTFKINCSDKLINKQDKNNKINGNIDDIKELGPVILKRAGKLISSVKLAGMLINSKTMTNSNDILGKLILICSLILFSLNPKSLNSTEYKDVR